MQPHSSYGIVPAAGRSRRMQGRHKLLLPWNTSTVIDHVLAAWTRSGAERVVVVVRRDDDDLARVCQNWPVDLVFAEPEPPDMKASVWCGLEYLAALRPSPSCRWLVAPADVPQLSCSLIDQVIAAGTSSESILVPRFAGKSGHPVSFPWSLKPAVAELPSTKGLSWLIEQGGAQWLDFPSSQRPRDMDTPQDYQQLIEAEVVRQEGGRLDAPPENP